MIHISREQKSLTLVYRKLLIQPSVKLTSYITWMTLLILVLQI